MIEVTEKIRLKDSLSGRLMTAMTLIYFGVTAVMTLTNFYIVYGDTKEQVKKELQLIEKAFALNLSYSLWTFNNNHVNSNGIGILQSPIVKGVQIYNQQGQMQFSQGLVSNETGDELYIGESGQQKKALDSGLFSYKFDLVQKSGKKEFRTGRVVVYSNDTVILNRVTLGFYIIIANALITSIILCAFFLWAFKYYLINPLKSMTRQVEKIDLQTLDEIFVSALRSNKNELVLFADKINLMIRNVKSSRNELLSLNLGLESMVSERTAELAMSNEDLMTQKERAEAANQAKSVFLANMSHEIRTPMNAVLGFTEILKGTDINAKQSHYIESIHSSGKALLSLINDILDLSKVEAGKLELQYGSVSLGNLFAELETIFQQKAADKGLKINIVIDPNTPSALVMDETRIRQVLINLIGNALKFTDKGFIRLSVECTFSESTHSQVGLTLKVSDSGIGIPADQCDKIFGAFEQISGQKVKVYGGTGLGLAISKRLVQMMGGTVHVESQLGKGSSFILNIPAVEVAAVDSIESGEGTIADADCIHFEPAAILVADDVDYNREILKTYLGDFGFSIIDAVDGKDTLSKIYDVHPDLILLDMKMPGMSGYDVARTLNADSSVVDIPVIAVTASALTKDEEVISKLCDGYLRKPVTREQLITEVMKHLPYTVSEESAVELPENQCVAEIAAAQIPEDLSLIPEEFIAEMHKAVKIGYASLISELIESISTDFPIFSAQLQKAADNFDFAAALGLLDKLDSKEVPVVLSTEQSGELKALLSGELHNDWERCSQKFIFSDIAAFAEKIKELAEQYNYQPLAKWADELKLQTDLFSTTTVKTLLLQYPEFIEDCNTKRSS